VKNDAAGKVFPIEEGSYVGRVRRKVKQKRMGRAVWARSRNIRFVLCRGKKTRPSKLGNIARRDRGKLANSSHVSDPTLTAPPRARKSRKGEKTIKNTRVEDQQGLDLRDKKQRGGEKRNTKIPTDELNWTDLALNFGPK